jgi:hypothetical protein
MVCCSRHYNKSNAILIAQKLPRMGDCVRVNLHLALKWWDYLCNSYVSPKLSVKLVSLVALGSYKD